MLYAEEEGFEPPLPFSKTVFKTAAFDRSATPLNRNEYLQLLNPEHDLLWDAVQVGSVVSTVELPTGFEPVTFSLQVSGSTN